jgi:hypothetical protein
MQENVEEFILIGVVFAVIVIVVIFYVFLADFSPVFPVGCNNNNIIENQFTQAEYGYANRMEGTPLFRCYLTDACYDQATANQTCITHWCYYLSKQPGSEVTNVQTCIQFPSAYPQVIQGCRDLSPANTAALESCQKSTIVADNSTNIENCAINIPTCVAGDSKFCPPCAGQ